MAEAHVLLVPPGVEGSGDAAGIRQGVGRQPDARALPGDQSDLFEATEPFANDVPLGQCVEIGDAATQQIRNGLASTLIQRTAMNAARGREPIGADRLMPCTGILGVLEQAVGECADRAGAQPDDDVGGVVGKALEIAAQRSVRRRPRQRVLGQREMIEADSPVARPGQPLMRQRRLAETRRRIGRAVASMRRWRGMRCGTCA